MRLALLALLLAQADDLDAVVPDILEKDKIPGAVVVIGTKDKVATRRAYGAAKLDTIYDLASCTKVIATTTAAMKLVEDGGLALDDPVAKHLPAFKGRGFTIRQLLTHRTGLPAYLTPKGRTPDAILEEIAALKADGAFRYS